MNIETARKERLNRGLLSLAAWCVARASGASNPETTMTMLKRKVEGLAVAVDRAGHAVAPLDEMAKQKAEMDRHEFGSPLWDRAYQLWKSAHQQWQRGRATLTPDQP